MARALTISATDCLGVAGIQKDIENFLANGVKYSSVTTSIIAQNRLGEFRIEELGEEIIKRQMKAIFEELDFNAIKVGTIIKEKNIKAIGKLLRRRGIPNIVLNPQFVNMDGEAILSEGEKKGIIRELFPIAYLLVLSKRDVEEILKINLHENIKIEPVLEKIKNLGPVNILIRNLKVEDDEYDILYDGEELTYFKGENLNIKDTYILGENMSSAITANIAKGASVKNAIKKSREYIKEIEIKDKSIKNIFI